MALISFSPLQDGVTGVNAAATNTPLSTIYNDYNGNITDANIASAAAIAFSKISGGSATALIATVVWSPTIGGFSANPTGGLYYYVQIGKVVTLFIAMPNNGTSNATTITLSLPVTARTLSGMEWSGFGGGVDNGTPLTTPSLLYVASSSPSTLTIFKDTSGASFTTSGNKRLVRGTIQYEAA